MRHFLLVVALGAPIFMNARGYALVSLAEAMKDAAYRTRDDYVGNAGPSWLHRWRVAKGLPPKLSAEPDPPKWVIELSR